ncbi:MAG: S-layer homology domain-containing protein, partial [Clostridia bacterium]|nr:S-layer homology domain-containing protein [Clostridia bacterium]
RPPVGGMGEMPQRGMSGMPGMDGQAPQDGTNSMNQRPGRGNMGEMPQGGMSGMPGMDGQAPQDGTNAMNQRPGRGNMGEMPQGGMNGQGSMGAQFGMNGGAGGVSISAGSTVVIKDASGNTLYTATAPKSVNSVVFASDGLKAGETYTIYVNGSEAASAEAVTGSGFSGGMGMGGQPGGMAQRDAQGGGSSSGGASGGSSGGASSEKTDAPSDWAKPEIGSAIEKGIVPDGLQRNYRERLTRGDAAEMFVRLIEKSSGQDIDSFLEKKGVKINEGAFSDTKDKSVLAANALGIINGRGNGVFDPNGQLKRSEITAILNRTANVMGIETKGFGHEFTDVGGHWVDGELGWAVNLGIIIGRGNGIFDPDAFVTDEEAIAITYRALNAIS